MKKIAIALSLLLLAADGSVWAQGGGGGGGGGSSGSGSGSSSSGHVPIGHRQPRASEFRDEKNPINASDQANKEDAALDKKIKSICRGC